MSESLHLDGRGLASWAHRATQELATRCAEINELNVFPVPDADTGSNMTHTMEAAVNELAKLTDSQLEDAAQVATALAAGSVRGARGNSGVVLSQVLRGIAQVAAGGELNGAAVIDALNVALDMVLKAISMPVDGTVVTVLRATVSAVNAMASTNQDTALPQVVSVALDAARVALQKTPSQLPALRSAGVVDAGGQGFVVLLEALAAEVLGRGTPVAKHAAIDTDTAAAELEVMFYFRGERLDELVQRIDAMGNSLLVARDSDTSGKVHIHTDEAGEVIETAFAMGEVSELRLEILPPVGTTGAPTNKRLVVAIAPEGPIAELYAQAGAVVVVKDDDDVVNAIVDAVRAAAVDEVILLPNGMLEYGELVNAELASHAIDASMNILPTARLVSGIAALAVHDPAQPLAADTYAMAEAAGSMRTAVLDRVAESTITQAGTARTGDIVVTSGVDALYVSRDLQAALETAVLRLLSTGGELVTLLVTAAARREISVEDLHIALGPMSTVEVTVYPAEGIEHLIEIGVE